MEKIVSHRHLHPYDLDFGVDGYVINFMVKLTISFNMSLQLTTAWSGFSNFLLIWKLEKLCWVWYIVFVDFLWISFVWRAWRGPSYQVGWFVDLGNNYVFTTVWIALIYMQLNLVINRKLCQRLFHI